MLDTLHIDMLRPGQAAAANHRDTEQGILLLVESENSVSGSTLFTPL